jgi:4-hydroxybenzoate polyprenyltransferase
MFAFESTRRTHKNILFVVLSDAAASLAPSSTRPNNATKLLLIVIVAVFGASAVCVLGP